MSNIYEKLRKAQVELKAPKGQYNSFGKYSYRSAEDILEAVKPINLKHGLTLHLSDEIVLVGDRFYIKATATVSDGESQIVISAYARESEAKKGMDESQITGTASSYARKYALNGLYLIDDTKDADTDEHHKQTNQGQKQTSKKAAQTTQKVEQAPTPEQQDEYTKQANRTLADALIKHHGYTGKTIKEHISKVAGKPFEQVSATESYTILMALKEEIEK